MKKSNVIRVSKQPLNFPSDQSAALQLNKSLPSLIEFLESPTVNAHFRDSLKEHPTPTDQSLKPRTHTKVPSKRLAILLDAYADQSVNKLHHTVDVGKKSSREGSVKSPHNMSEDVQKPNHARQFSSSISVKGSEFLKSKDFSKMMVSKVLGKNNQKSIGQEKDFNNTQESQEFQAEARGLAKQQSEASFFKNPFKTASKPLAREDKKNGNARDDSLKQSKLRRIKVIYNNNNSISEKAGALNMTQPHSTKHHPYGSYSMLNSTVAPTLKTTVSPVRKIDRTMVQHHRLSTSPSHPDVNSSSFQFNVNQTGHSRPKERERDTHKKTLSIGGNITLGFEVPRARANIASKNSLGGHRKGASGVLAASTSLLTKPQSDTDRELALRTSVEHPKRPENRLPIEKTWNMTGSGPETLLSEPTTRHDEDSGSGLRQTMHLKSSDKVYSGDNSGKVFDESSQIGSEPYQKFENAFYAFSEHHLRNIDPRHRESELEKVIKAWNGFIEVFRGGPYQHKKDSDIMPLKKDIRIQDMAYAQDSLPNRKQLIASALTQNLEQNSYVNDPLNQIVEEQKQLINILKRNEEKMMKLICTIKKQGYDVEKIYWDEVKKTGDDYMQNYEFPDLSKREEEASPIAESQIIEESSRRSSMMASVDVSFSENPSFGPNGFESAYNNMNFELKNKLKLNFNELKMPTKAPGEKNEPPVAKLDLNIFGKKGEGNQEEPQGFHDEFMSKIDEFSLSWRQAAVNQRNF